MLMGSGRTQSDRLWRLCVMQGGCTKPEIESSTVVSRWDEKAGLRTGCGVRSQVIDVLKAQLKRRPAMKKVSIVAAQRSTKISRQKLTVGLDLGDRSSWYCVLDETGQTVLEQKLSTTAKGRLKRERPMCTERNESLLESADGSMATVATRRENKTLSPEKQTNPLDSDRPSHGRRLHSLTPPRLSQ